MSGGLVLVYLHLLLLPISSGMSGGLVYVHLLLLRISSGMSEVAPSERDQRRLSCLFTGNKYLGPEVRETLERNTPSEERERERERETERERARMCCY